MSSIWLPEAQTTSQYTKGNTIVPIKYYYFCQTLLVYIILCVRIYIHRVMEYLLKYSQSLRAINERNSQFHTPLHVAVIANQPMSIRILLKSKVRTVINAIPLSVNCVYHHSCNYNHATHNAHSCNTDVRLMLGLVTDKAGHHYTMLPCITTSPVLKQLWICL